MRIILMKKKIYKKNISGEFNTKICQQKTNKKLKQYQKILQRST